MNLPSDAGTAGLLPRKDQTVVVQHSIDPVYEPDLTDETSSFILPAGTQTPANHYISQNADGSITARHIKLKSGIMEKWCITRWPTTKTPAARSKAAPRNKKKAGQITTINV